MDNLPILYYRKLKKKPNVFIMDLQTRATLDLSNEVIAAFVGITEEHTTSGGNIYYGQLESYTHSATNMNCELELYDNCFADDKKYSKSEVENILHPLIFAQQVLEGTNEIYKNPNYKRASWVVRVCKRFCLF